jgi:hypothetical protein
MKINQKLAALLLITAGTLSTQVNAQESSDVEKIVTNIVGTAMNTVSFEIDQQIEKITLTATHLMSFDGENEKMGKVTITDLSETKNEAKIVNKTSEKENAKKSD